MVDRVHPLKIEDTSTGGDETDVFPTSMDKNEDYLDSRGATFQSPTSDDEAVKIDRSVADDQLQFKDGENATELLLSQVVAGLVDEGPLLSAWCETLPAGNPFPTQSIWWESVSKVRKLLEQVVTYNANKTFATEVWKLYDKTGTLILTITDTIAYSGVFETSRTRVRT